MPTATANRKFVYGTHGMYILAELIRDIAELALFCIRDWSLELGARSQDHSNHEPGQHRATQPFFWKGLHGCRFFLSRNRYETTVLPFKQQLWLHFSHAVIFNLACPLPPRCTHHPRLCFSPRLSYEHSQSLTLDHLQSSFVLSPPRSQRPPTHLHCRIDPHTRRIKAFSTRL